MAKNIKISLDDAVLEVYPIAYLRNKGDFLCSIRGKVIFLDGREVETGVRYDFGKRGIIDPILQDDDLKKYVAIDESKYLVSKSPEEFISMDGNYQRWLGYIDTVGKALAASFENKKIKMKYGC